MEKQMQKRVSTRASTAWTALQGRAYPGISAACTAELLVKSHRSTQPCPGLEQEPSRPSSAGQLQHPCETTSGAWSWDPQPSRAPSSLSPQGGQPLPPKLPKKEKWLPR